MLPMLACVTMVKFVLGFGKESVVVVNVADTVLVLTVVGVKCATDSADVKVEFVVDAEMVEVAFGVLEVVVVDIKVVDVVFVEVVVVVDVVVVIVVFVEVLVVDVLVVVVVFVEVVLVVDVVVVDVVFVDVVELLVVVVVVVVDDVLVVVVDEVVDVTVVVFVDEVVDVEVVDVEVVEVDVDVVTVVVGGPRLLMNNWGPAAGSPPAGTKKRDEVPLTVKRKDMTSPLSSMPPPGAGPPSKSVTSNMAVPLPTRLTPSRYCEKAIFDVPPTPWSQHCCTPCEEAGSHVWRQSPKVQLPLHVFGTCHK